MITNEREIRIALEAMLACALAFYGLWSCALVVVLLMLPWAPLLAVGAYLVQPLVDWRVRKARVRHEKGLAQFVRELDALLPAPREPLRPASPLRFARVDPPLELPAAPGFVESLPETIACGPQYGEVPGSARDLPASLEIPPAIRTHLQSQPQGVFSNMQLDVEAVNFHGDTAEALVKFQSARVSGLVIRRRYVLRQLEGRWQVESREPANGSGKPPHARAPSGAASIRW